MKTLLRAGLISGLMALLGAGQTHAQLTLPHSFWGPPGDGAAPIGDLVLSGTMLYGVTSDGGSGAGVIYRKNLSDTGYTLLHTFDGSPDDGFSPRSGMTLSGTMLYGTTGWGGFSSNGVVFSLNTEGSGHTILHHFAGPPGDGAVPFSSPTVSGTALYGMTRYGGTSGKGVIFRMTTAGTVYVILHNFTGGPGDGEGPCGSLTLSGTTLYGTAERGGSSDDGVVFRLNVDGSGYTILHHFDISTGDGARPNSSLTLSGTTLYGMTGIGGLGGYGSVFRLNTDGSGHTILHNFFSGAGDGSEPYFSSLTLSGTTLYGTTDSGGAANWGVVFRMNTDSSGYTNLHEFASGAGVFGHPQGSVTLSGTTLYGTMTYGGDYAHGAVFALALPSALAPGSVDLGGGWKWLSWFGFFNDGASPWIYHNEHGWMYTPSTTPSDIWFYTSDMGWLWTGSATYPYLYRSSTGQWLWYQKDSDNPRWFYNFGTSSWESR